MKVYRDVDGKPELAGECDLRWDRGGLFPEAIVIPRQVYGSESPFYVRETWMTGLVVDYDAAGMSHSEYVIKLRPEDNPEHLPGWQKLLPQELTIEEMVRNIFMSFSHNPPAFTRGLIIGYLEQVRHRTEEAFRREAIEAPTQADLQELDKRIQEALRREPALTQLGDPDGTLVPLPQKPQPEEKPYIPQKWGEHD